MFIHSLVDGHLFDSLNNAAVNIHLDFPGSANGKELACQCKRHKRLGFSPWVGKIPGGGHANPSYYSCLENPMDSGVWWATIHRVAKKQTQLKQHSTHAQKHSLTRIWLSPAGIILVIYVGLQLLR